MSARPATEPHPRLPGLTRSARTSAMALFDKSRQLGSRHRRRSDSGKRCCTLWEGRGAQAFLSGKSGKQRHNIMIWRMGCPYLIGKMKLKSLPSLGICSWMSC